MVFWDKKVNINGNELHLVEWPGTGDTIVCIHGITGNSHWWDKIAEELSPLHRIIAYDLPGRGDSAIPPTPHGLEEHAEDVLTIVNRLGLDSIILVGHSLGASIACYFAAKYGHRLKRMVLIDGGIDQTPKIRQALALTLNTLGHVFGSFAECTEFTRHTLFKGDWSQYAERLYYHDVVHRPDGTVTAKSHKHYILQELGVVAARKSSVNETHRKISTPTLLLCAPQGFGLSGISVLTRGKGEEIAALIPGSRLTVIEESNHATIMFKDQTGWEIKNFLTGPIDRKHHTTNFEL